MRSSWKGLGVALAAAAVALLAAGLVERSQRARRESLVGMAWEVRRGDRLAEALAALPEPPPGLDRARQHYLAGEFEACLRAMEGVRADRLRAEAETGFLFEIPWPGRAAASVRLDLDGDGINELLRALDPGLGRPPRQERLELFRWRQGRFEAVPLQVQRPVGGKLELKNALRLEALELDAPAAGCFFGEGLWVVRREGERFAAFLFRSSAPVTVDKGEIVSSEGRWRWQEGKLVRAGASPGE